MAQVADRCHFITLGNSTIISDLGYADFSKLFIGHSDSTYLQKDLIDTSNSQKIFLVSFSTSPTSKKLVRYGCNRCGKLIGDNNYTVHIIRDVFDDDMAKHKTLDKKIEDPLRLV